MFRNRWAAVVLALLAPVVAELAFGSTPPRMAYLVLLWVPIYGAGVVLIRESVRRVGGRWPSLVLLGVAYEIAEDGFGLQALTSPHLYGPDAHWLRAAGLNLPYWAANAGYHVVFSVLVPIAVTELLFRRYGRRPYLGRVGLTGTGIVAVLGVALVRLTVPPSQDPGYQAPLPALAAFGAAIAALAVVALAVLPRLRPRVPTTRPPGPVVLAGFGAVATFAFLGVLLPFGAYLHSPLARGPLVAVPLSVGALAALTAVGCLRRWALSETDARWLIGGALVAHTALGAWRFGHDLPDVLAIAAIGALTLLPLVLAARRATAAGIPSPAPEAR